MPPYLVYTYTCFASEQLELNIAVIENVEKFYRNLPVSATCILVS